MTYEGPLRSLLQLCAASLLVTLAVVGCTHRPPATPQDYKTGITGNSRGRVETYEVSDRPEVVADRLDRAFGACFEVTIRHCTYGYGGGCVPERHFHTFEQNLDGTYTLTERMHNRSRGGPALRDETGALYELVVDVAGKMSGPGSSVTVYGADNHYWDRLFASVQGWAHAVDGNPACPNLERTWSDLGRGRQSQGQVRPAPPPPPPSN